MTTNDPLRAYAEASRQLVIAHERGQAMVERIHATSEPFRSRWAELRVVNGREFAGGDGGHDRVDLEDWPNREEVWDTIKTYHDAFANAVHAWQQIPPDDRFGLRAPIHPSA